ncbi:MAG: GFA family protein [Alphaproteobacteria bacterium]
MLETREGGCHCGRVRFRARIDLDILSQCSCSICTKKGILHLPIFPADFELLSGKDALTLYTFETGVAQHPFCAHCGIAAFYVPRSQPDKITVNARCLDNIDGPGLTPPRFFDGQDWEAAQRKRIAGGGHLSAEGAQGATTLQAILDRAPG